VNQILCSLASVTQNTLLYSLNSLVVDKDILNTMTYCVFVGNHTGSWISHWNINKETRYCWY